MLLLLIFNVSLQRFTKFPFHFKFNTSSGSIITGASRRHRYIVQIIFITTFEVAERSGAFVFSKVKITAWH